MRWSSVRKTYVPACQPMPVINTASVATSSSVGEIARRNERKMMSQGNNSRQAIRRSTPRSSVMR